MVTNIITNDNSTIVCQDEDALDVQLPYMLVHKISCYCIF